MYSVEYPAPRGRAHRHHHHHPSHPQAAPPRRRNHQGRRVSVQNTPISRRSTGYRRQVVIDESEYSPDHPDEDEDDDDEEEDDGVDDGLGRRRSVPHDSSDSSDDRILEGDEEDTTVRARQEALNTRHPFGLPIWKPALYKKSRSVTRAAFLALHARPLRSETLYLKPGNIAWMLLAGWWLLLVCMLISAFLYITPFGGSYYARVARGLGWYLFWPFGRYVERIKDDVHSLNRCTLSSVDTTLGVSALESGLASAGAAEHEGDEDEPLLGSSSADAASCAEAQHSQFRRKTALGRAVYYALLVAILNPILILVSALAWFAVFSIPMGKLTHTLSRYLWRDPLSLHFRSGDLPTIQIPETPATADARQTAAVANDADAVGEDGDPNTRAVVEQPAPTVLLCTNEAVGWYYYKYTVDGVNILFYNMLSIAVFVLVAAFVIAPLTHHKHFLVQPSVLFPLCLVATIPLAYFIGQAVSSISAQSSLGMGAVINATFGSIVEVILYSIALTQGKARLVEGALIGSLLAGLMLMPGTSMIAGGVKHKVQRFNAKSAEVTATLIIMSIIGAFAPTLFYHTFAVPEFDCEEEAVAGGGTVRKCKQANLDIINDPFYLNTVKPFMYFCAAILPLAYLIALWFSLKTHVKHIYSSSQTSNPIIRHVLEVFRRTLGPDGITRAANRSHQHQPLDPERAPVPAVTITRAVALPTDSETAAPGDNLALSQGSTQAEPATSPASPVKPSRISRSSSAHHHSHHHHHHLHPRASTEGGVLAYDPANAPSSLPNVPRLSELPRVLAADPDDQLPDLALLEGVASGDVSHEGGGGHDAPNWSKFKSAFILCMCTVMFSLIAEVLVDTVDVVVQSLGIREKYVGLTLFALVPNVTEFMNAIAFAMQNNIALSIEISNAYTVQVALLQIPILVFFSAFYGVPDYVKTVVPSVGLGKVRSAVDQWLTGSTALASASSSEGHLPTDPSAYVFALIFPRWDLIAILFCVFLLTYMLIEGKANYFKGSILCLSYFVWMVSYAFEPARK
ncbi:hypothetical protein GGI12_004242 [Dipsacomyces acuminosporus]|nr:hypothetical protein GGI12_004242 [Dipsacomyces acuminosporus]